MTSWYESHIDRQIREAQELGEFDDLPGAGKPLPGFGQEYDENWWLKQLIEREKMGMAGQCTRQGDTLLLAAGQYVRPIPFTPFKSDLAQHVLCMPSALYGVCGSRQAKLHIRHHALPWQ